MLIGGCATHRAPDPARVVERIEQRAGWPVPAAAGPTGALPAGVSLSDGLDEDEAVTLALARAPPAPP